MLAYEVIGGVEGIPSASGFTDAVDGVILSGFMPVTSLMVPTDKLSTVMADEVKLLSPLGELPNSLPRDIAFLFHQKY